MKDVNIAKKNNFDIILKLYLRSNVSNLTSLYKCDFKANVWKLKF